MNKYNRAAQLLSNGTKNGYPIVDNRYASLFVVAGLLGELYDAGLITYTLDPSASIEMELRATIAKRESHAARDLILNNLGGPFQLSE